MSANLPAEMNLASNRPMSAQGIPNISRFRADNSTYSSVANSTDVIRIEIPTGRAGSMLFPRDSFLEGKLTVTGQDVTAAMSYYLDQSAYSLFSRMRIYHGSTIIEDYLNFGRVITSVYDLQVNEVARRGDGILKLINDTTSAVDLCPIFNDGCSGAKVLTTGNANIITVGSVLDFSLVLPSGILGSLATKVTPLSLMGAASLYIELEISPSFVAFVTNSATTTSLSHTISDIYYNAKMVQLPADVHSLVVEACGGFVNLPAVSFKSEMKTISTGSSAFNDKWSFQFSSIKNFNFFFMNTNTAAGGITKRSISARPKCNLNDYFLLLNGNAYPSQAIANQSRMYAETLRAWGQLTNTVAGGILTYQNYNYNTHTPADDVIPANIAVTKQKRFVAAIDMDKFSHVSDTLMSGTSSIGQMVTLNLNFSTPTTDSLNLYAFVQYDVLYHLENGLLSPKW
jgi:hypothetical protein